MIETGSTAVVTGASSGIGEQFARQLAARGVNLVLTARNEVRLQSLTDQLKAAHPDVGVAVMTADLSVPTAAAELTEKLTVAGVTVDMLVNNAGFGSHDLFVDEDPDNVAREIQLNCGSLVALTARLLPGMLARGRGGVLNVASTAAFQPVPTIAVYAASKAFVLSFTEALWEETRGSGVRVLALCPGATETGFFEVTGKEFMTHGRQTPEFVAAVGLRAFDSGHGPSVVSGLANRMLANGYRFLPRGAMVRLARMNVRAARTPPA
ncbi:SDR family oxidoreductase [Nocardia sp. NPDC049190]|uniref:SDR family NAD(P)-dependent oxidoreductase n=1 Tax=Nocardia sp. NPDC049190 TaxID=3155650 RepID=UPI0033FF33A4